MSEIACALRVNEVERILPRTTPRDGEGKCSVHISVDGIA